MLQYSRLRTVLDFSLVIVAILIGLSRMASRYDIVSDISTRWFVLVLSSVTLLAYIGIITVSLRNRNVFPRMFESMGLLSMIWVWAIADIVEAQEAVTNLLYIVGIISMFSVVSIGRALRSRGKN